jgi:hypothetical protein
VGFVFSPPVSTQRHDGTPSAQADKSPFISRRRLQVDNSLWPCRPEYLFRTMKTAAIPLLPFRCSSWIEVGGDDSTTYTRMRAPFVNKDVLSLKIYRAGLFAPVGPLLGIQDIQIGDPSFDENFVIQGNNHMKTRWLLGDTTLKELIQMQPNLCLEIRHDDGTWDDKDLLIFKCRGVLKDETGLKKLFDLFCTALARLAQADSSSRQTIPPRVTPVYETPDGWSQVLCHLPEHAAVTVCGTDGNFLKVTTEDRVVGYISHRLAIALSRLRGTDLRLHRVHGPDRGSSNQVVRSPEESKAPAT